MSQHTREVSNPQECASPAPWDCCGGVFLFAVIHTNQFRVRDIITPGRMRGADEYMKEMRVCLIVLFSLAF